MRSALLSRRAWAWAWLWAQTSMVALLPTLSNFLSNRYEVAAEDLPAPVVVDLVMGGGVAETLAALVLATGYEGRLDAVLPVLQAALPIWNNEGAAQLVASGVFMALMGTAAYWAGRAASAVARRWRWNSRDSAVALGIGVAVTFAGLAVPLARDLALEWPQFFYRPPQLAPAPAGAKDAAKPDIYYIVLDRYASEDVLKQQFSFDNADFLSFLKEQGYYTNPSAHNNYPFTTMSIASTMDANYLNDAIGRFGQATAQTVVPFNESIRQSAVAQHLRSLGYRYDLIGNWYETSNVSPIADRTYQRTGRLTVFNHDVTLNTFAKNVLVQAPFWRFVQPGWRIGGLTIFSYENQSDVDMHHYALQTLREEANRRAGGRFIFAHILVPHDPYYFNADGSLSNNPSTDNVGALVKQKYVGQVEFINSQMKDILSTIKRRSQGQAVVVLQADEGPYPNQLNDEEFNETSVNDELKGGDMRQWSTANLQMKFGNLAAYYVPAAQWEQDAPAADSVNIFRLVLNRYFGENLAYLPDCYYAYPDGKNFPMRFADITPRLTGQPTDGRCLADGRVKE